MDVKVARSLQIPQATACSGCNGYPRSSVLDIIRFILLVAIPITA